MHIRSVSSVPDCVALRESGDRKVRWHAGHRPVANSEPDLAFPQCSEVGCRRECHNAGKHDGGVRVVQLKKGLDDWVVNPVGQNRDRIVAGLRQRRLMGNVERPMV